MAIQNFDEAMKSDHMPFAVMVGGKDYKGYFANIRIARDSVPDGCAYMIFAMMTAGIRAK